MAGMIPQSFIDDLLERIDIVDVIDARVKLKKTGKNFMACCPFHDEKTPSFSVSPDKQLYHCFGCGASGNSLGFIMAYDRQDFPVAIEALAKVAGLDVPREQISPAEQARQDKKTSLFGVLAKAADFYRQALAGHSQAQDYLNKRGLSQEVIDAYGIGFVTSGWRHLLDHLKPHGIDERMAAEAGLAIHHEQKNRYYDRFRERIMFPIRNTKGQTVGFGGRVLNDDKPKYINSPETTVFHKSRELYGLFEARQAHRDIPRLLVVEGYMDVVALAQFGINYAVATLGTACGEEHLQKAFKATTEVVFCFDGDSAGRKAAFRAMENALAVMQDGRQIRFLYLPEGEDPDSLVRQIGQEKFTRLIESAAPLEQCLFDELSRDIDSQSMEGRARLCKLAVPHLDTLPNGVYRELMFEQLAKRTELSVSVLKRLLEETKEGVNAAQSLPEDSHSAPSYECDRPVSYAPVQAPKPQGDVTPTLVGPEGLMITLLLYDPALGLELNMSDLMRCHLGQVPLLVQLVTLIQERPNFSSSQILGHWQGLHDERELDVLTGYMERANERYKAHTLCAEDPDRAFDAASELQDALISLRKRLSQKAAEHIIARLSEIPMQEWSDDDKQMYRQAVMDQSSAF